MQIKATPTTILKILLWESEKWASSTKSDHVCVWAL